MMKPLEAGGLAFEEASADRVMLLADGQKTVVAASQPPRKIVLPEELSSLKEVGARDMEYDLANLPKKKDFQEIVKGLDAAHELPAAPEEKLLPKPGIAQTPVARPPAPKAAEVKPAPEEIKKEKPKPAPARPEKMPPPLPEERIIPMMRRPVDSGKIKMEDIKAIPRVMGPLDELKFMDLVTFRRLDREAGKAADKIKEKIALLEEDAYSKRMEGIKNWRLSPLNKLYLSMGEASISGNKPIDVIIEERKKEGKESLRPEEFEAVMDLNKSLRF